MSLLDGVWFGILAGVAERGHGRHRDSICRQVLERIRRDLMPA